MYVYPAKQIFLDNLYFKGLQNLILHLMSPVLTDELNYFNNLINKTKFCK